MNKAALELQCITVGCNLDQIKKARKQKMDSDSAGSTHSASGIGTIRRLLVKY
jgi:hypothetical protein